jgi:hypothetical protein
MMMMMMMMNRGFLSFRKRFTRLLSSAGTTYQNKAKEIILSVKSEPRHLILSSLSLAADFQQVGSKASRKRHEIIQ